MNSSGANLNQSNSKKTGSKPSSPKSLLIRHLAKQPYEPIWQAMKKHTDTRDSSNIDELWSLQHSAIFTQGQAGKAEHILAPGDIPIIQVDRGGQVTYHGPGQIVIYFLIDLKRKNLGVKELVNGIENSVIALLNEFNIDAVADPDAPGVYVGGAKIGSVGLRIRKGCSYHGLSLNVDMDLEPFSRINPCGYKGLKVTQLKDLTSEQPRKNKDFVQDVEKRLLSQLMSQLAYNDYEEVNHLNRILDT